MILPSGYTEHTAKYIVTLEDKTPSIDIDNENCELIYKEVSELDNFVSIMLGDQEPFFVILIIYKHLWIRRTSGRDQIGISWVHVYECVGYYKELTCLNG